MAVNVNIPKPIIDYNDLENKPTLVTAHSELNLDDGTNPHGTTASDVGTYTATEMDNLLNDKVDKVAGKGLSTEDYTSSEKTKLAGIEAGAEVNVNADWNATSGDAQILNKPTIPSITSLVPYTGATSDVDLGNYALNAKSVKVNGTGGNGHVGLKHQASNATAGGSETALFAGSDGELYYKNDGNALAQIASRAWVTAQGFITNVITALGYTPVPNTRTINGYDLTTNRSLSASDVGAVASNGAITGATKTKITYDSKGLVTSGADATTADIADSTLKRYVPIDKCVFKEQYGGTVTGTTTETIIKTFTFSANELPTDTTLYAETLGYRTGTPTNNGTFRIKINTSNTLTGATQLAAWGMGGNTNTHSQSRRRFAITSGNIIGIASGSSLNTDITTAITAESINTLDVTNIFYIFITYTPANSGDTLNHAFTILKNF